MPSKKPDKAVEEAADKSLLPYRVDECARSEAPAGGGGFGDDVGLAEATAPRVAVIP